MEDTSLGPQSNTKKKRNIFQFISAASDADSSPFQSRRDAKQEAPPQDVRITNDMFTYDVVIATGTKKKTIQFDKHIQLSAGEYVLKIENRSKDPENRIVKVEVKNLPKHDLKGSDLSVSYPSRTHENPIEPSKDHSFRFKLLQEGVDVITPAVLVETSTERTSETMVRLIISQEFLQLKTEVIQIPQDKVATFQTDIDRVGLYQVRISKLDNWQQYKQRFIARCWCTISVGENIWRYSVDAIGAHWASSPFIVTKQDLADLDLEGPTSSADSVKEELEAQLTAEEKEELLELDSRRRHAFRQRGIPLVVTFGMVSCLQENFSSFKVQFCKVADSRFVSRKTELEDVQMTEFFKHKIKVAYQKRRADVLDTYLQHVRSSKQIYRSSKEKYAEIETYALERKKRLNEYFKLAKQLETLTDSPDIDPLSLDNIEFQAKASKFTDLETKITRFKGAVEADKIKLLEISSHLASHFQVLQKLFQSREEDEIYIQISEKDGRIDDYFGQQTRVSLLKSLKEYILQRPKSAAVWKLVAVQLLLSNWVEIHDAFIGNKDFYMEFAAENDIENYAQHLAAYLDLYITRWQDFITLPSQQEIEDLVEGINQLETWNDKEILQMTNHCRWYASLNLLKSNNRKYLSLFDKQMQDMMFAALEYWKKILQVIIKRVEGASTVRGQITNLIVTKDRLGLQSFIFNMMTQLQPAELDRCRKILDCMKLQTDFTHLLTKREKKKLGIAIDEDKAIISQPLEEEKKVEEQADEYDSEPAPIMPSHSTVEVEEEQTYARDIDSTTSSLESQSPVLSPVAPEERPIYQFEGVPDTYPILSNLLQETRDSLPTVVRTILQEILNYFKKKLAEGVSIETAGKELNSNMEIGQLMRNQFIPVFIRIFEIGLKVGEHPWSFVEKTAMKIGKEMLQDVLEANEKSNENNTKFRIFICKALNSKRLPVYFKDCLVSEAVADFYDEFWKNDTKQNLLTLIKNIVKVQFELDLNPFWNQYDPYR